MRFPLYSPPYPPGLKINAMLISVSLIALTVILGVRAYSVARVHLVESKALVERDVPLQDLLFALDSAVNAKQLAEKKWAITRDPVYAKLIAKYRDTILKEAKAISLLRSGLIPAVKAKTSVSELRDIVKHAQEVLSQEREKNVRHASDAAAGLLRLILVAVVLSIVITAWMMVLFYHGLIRPLRHLRDATTRIREGDLSCRMRAEGLTELREIAQDFNSMAARLESLDQAKNEFLATISHEIRNPMAALKEGLNLLSSEERKLSTESQKKCLSACLIASKRLEFMINNLLNLSKTGSGIFEADFSNRNLSSAIQTAVDEVRPLAEKKSIALRLVAPETVLAFFHWDGVVQAFVNLLLNAIKYGLEGSLIEVSVGVSESTGAGVQVDVTNSGVDIARDELSKIFDRFYRGANSVKQQGMGIGLHVVKKVVEAHRGDVNVSSESGKTIFRVRLPVKTVQQSSMLASEVQL
ncbi:MAG TPA: HAMP domain-containing sensor histidine kinase [Bdellovibrionota bacterium]|nr:HAMP domain-containing sensor histidine kinase [Bdellovibrionota bacterium]